MEALEERIVLSYLGSFRVPRDDGSGRVRSEPKKYSYSYGGDVSGVDAEGDELWLSGHVYNQMIGKISIPYPVEPSNPNAFGELPIARSTAPAVDITQGLRSQALQDSYKTMVLGDLVSQGDFVAWVMHDYYNVSNEQYRVLGYTSLKTANAEGPYGLYDPSGQFVRDQLSGRYMTKVPTEWAGLVGGTFASGGGGLPGQSTIGAGPSLYAYTPPATGTDPMTRVTATPLLEYPFDDHLPEDQRRSLDGWNRACKPYDAVWVGDTVVVAARFAIGEVWYGSPDGPGDLYDWYINDKTYHAERYEMRLLFYKASDLAAVARGELNPWDPQPFASVPMPNLMGADSVSQTNDISMSWDKNTGRMYVVQTRVDQSRSRYDRNPVVHVYDLSGEDALKRWAFEMDGRVPTTEPLDPPTTSDPPTKASDYGGTGGSGTETGGDEPVDDSTSTPTSPTKASDQGGFGWGRTKGGDSGPQNDKSQKFEKSQKVGAVDDSSASESDDEGDIATTTESDDEGDVATTTEADGDVAQFWSLENDELLMTLNQ